jgi:hypothetical protein
LTPRDDLTERLREVGKRIDGMKERKVVRDYLDGMGDDWPKLLDELRKDTELISRKVAEEVPRIVRDEKLSPEAGPAVYELLADLMGGAEYASELDESLPKELAGKDRDEVRYWRLLHWAKAQFEADSGPGGSAARPPHPTKAVRQVRDDVRRAMTFGARGVRGVGVVCYAVRRDAAVAPPNPPERHAIPERSLVGALCLDDAAGEFRPHLRQRLTVLEQCPVGVAPDDEGQPPLAPAQRHHAGRQAQAQLLPVLRRRLVREGQFPVDHPQLGRHPAAGQPVADLLPGRRPARGE